MRTLYIVIRCKLELGLQVPKRLWRDIYQILLGISLRRRLAQAQTQQQEQIAQTVADIRQTLPVEPTTTEEQTQ